ncbi:Mu transposase, C-terminal [Loktanella sp. DSM 29012]|uniref:Mu transposase C-terminal domain-containing protein n=1 Tax=Loktanella sp. DSM 29012 TaxID=1881056 RepID=UPI0008CFA2DE|nr:Mu transposase C-terminal domain-containing protein [Loktanella sp. DSM 29012]SEQ86663.1 Mu transposase, C-terminal [Loktanella sp. DSM 29012]
MSEPFRPASMEPGTRFRANNRPGTCFQDIGTSILVGWDEVIDKNTGVISPASTDIVSKDEVGRLLRSGNLQILTLPGTALDTDETRRARIEIYKPGSGLNERALFRLSYIEAIKLLIDDGVLPEQPRRCDIETHLDDIEAARRTIRRKRRAACGGRRRAGGKEVGHIETECARSIHDWWNAFVADPSLGVYDNYNKSGNRTPRYSTSEDDYFRGVIDEMLTLERPHLAAIVDSVRAAVVVENDRRAKANPPLLPMQKPGRDYVTKLIKQISPVDFWSRTKGNDVAYRDLHTLGLGLQLTAPLQRVEIDEQTVDLMTLLREAKIVDSLGPAGLAALNFNVAKARVTISAALDCYTGCLLAFQITNKPDQNLTKRTIEMIYLDKTSIARAAGAVSDWDHSGQPTELALDKGGTYISEEAYLLLASSGIINFSLPGGHPFLKGGIEGFFRTLSGALMPHLVGRTFKDVVARGENDPEKRALIDIDTFLRMLTVWVVDVYHNTRPTRSGSLSPNERWARAMKEVPPNVRTDDRRLCKVFGDFKTRTLRREGLSVGGILYQSPELAEWLVKESQRKIDIWWWHKKIGRIEVRLPDGREISVPCKDPDWADASYADLTAFYDAIGDIDPKDELIAATALRNIDKEVLAMKRRLHGLLPLAPTEADLKRREADMQRFMKTRNQERPETRPLFGDVVDISVPNDPSALAADQDDHSIDKSPDDYSDILE